MDIDEALVKLGPIGKWQVLYWTLLGFTTMFPACLHMVAIVYIGYKPPHRCKIDENANVNESIPYENGQLSSCKMFVNYSLGNETTNCMNGWEYFGDDGPTIVTKWDLVCEKDGLSQMSQTVLVFGVMVGALFFTILADRFGRKTIFMLSQMAMIVTGLSVAFTNNIYMFYVLRFITGALQQGIILTGFILTCELFSAQYRSFSAIMIHCFWAICASFYPFIAMALKNWFHLQLLISLFGIITIPLFKYLPESTIWLCANNRSREAEKIIKDAAKMNGITFPHTLLRHSPSQIKNGGIFKSCCFESQNSLVEQNCASVSKYTLIDLFRNKRLACYVCISAVLWMVATLVYYGLTLCTGQMGGGRYMNAFFNAFVELPAYITSYFFIKRFGRKKPLIGYYLLAGISLLLATVVPEFTAPGTMQTSINIILSNIGKFGVSGVFGMIFLYTSELFPTNLRNQSLGISSFIGRIGNSMATFVAYAIERYPRLPGLIFGIVSIVASILVILLPETHNKPLPETIEDIEAWFDKSKEKKKNIIDEESTTLAN